MSPAWARSSTARHRAAVCFVAILVVLGVTVAAKQAQASSLTALTEGQALNSGDTLYSPDHVVKLQMQSDGNLVLRNASRTIWSAGTAGNPGARLTLQSDGNLVLRNVKNAVLYNAATQGHSGAALTVQDIGLAVLTSAGHTIWSSPDDLLTMGQSLVPNDALYSPNRAFRLQMQGDGNLVLRQGAAAVWSSGTSGHPGAWAAMQTDGNFVVYSNKSVALFNTETPGHARANLTLQNDGNVVIRLGNTALWSRLTGSSATGRAVNAAYAYGRQRGERVAVALFDRKTHRYYVAGDVDSYYASASVMKVFIATKLLVTGQSKNPTIANLMWRMITLSDDNAADYLYGIVGAAGVAPWAAARYHVAGIAATPISNYWGLTRITARAMVNYYNAVISDPTVGPWLLNAMANMHAPAADGWPQNFGIPSVSSGWRVKQGWMCCLDNLTRMHSTGFVNGDRYTVALLTEGSPADYGLFGRDTVTGMAARLLPHGTIPH
jgi:hypothetical protein